MAKTHYSVLESNFLYNTQVSRNMKFFHLSSLCIIILFACAIGTSQAWNNARSQSVENTLTTAEQQRRRWINKSLTYYSKVMREERRKNMGQIPDEVFGSMQYQDDFRILANKHYFAYQKIKEGQFRQAEKIYQRIICEIESEEEEGHCDHAKLAVTTLLLALHCQRMGSVEKTRDVFRSFFRTAVIDNDHQSECACSAKVLGAYALFEMKQGNINRGLVIAKKAVEFDEALRPVLNWKQFRDADSRQTIKRKQLEKRKDAARRSKSHSK